MKSVERDAILEEAAMIVDQFASGRRYCEPTEWDYGAQDALVVSAKTIRALKATPAPTSEREADGERCQDCGCAYEIVYRVPDDVWAQIAPDKAGLGDYPEHQYGGLLCPACADRRSRELGIHLYFDASVGEWRQEREAVLEAEWKRPCEACDGEGWIERGDMPLHHLHSEAPEYGKSDCGECDGEGWSWSDDDVPLAECPIGLFRHGDTLALKTEYGNNEGRIDAYIVSSGEFFWGAAPQSIASQRATLVRPITEIAALTTPAPAVSTDEICAHNWRCSDSSLYDFKCTKCGETE